MEDKLQNINGKCYVEEEIQQGEGKEHFRNGIKVIENYNIFSCCSFNSTIITITTKT